MAKHSTLTPASVAPSDVCSYRLTIAKAMTFSRSFLWFCVAGLVGLLVDVVALIALRNALGVYGARVASFLAAATVTWLLNRQVAFAGRQATAGLLGEYLQYLGLMTGGGLVNLATYSLLAWQFPQTPSWLGLYVAIGSVAGLAVNYLGASRWLYRDNSQ